MPDRPLPIAAGDALTFAFGHPVDLSGAEPLPREKCKLRYEPTEDPAVWTVSVPAYVWSDSPRGCGTGENVTDAVDVTYRGDDEFTGYWAAFGLSIKPDRS